MILLQQVRAKIVVEGKVEANRAVTIMIMARPTTDNHPFWAEGKGWGFADELQIGDKLQKADGSNLTIDKVEFVKLVEPVMVYNFTVANYHTYYVTDLGIWA
ncbi:polymorphic toxin-type HINT domain-containing protein [Paenibacillus sp. cl6col]|uniref:polymorphic toxin-type HINT domain-containing protein n=1 Tax=Paenibacillus sp. cl6col TaxID=1761878 RepID=UPI000B3307EB|nr:polymorphic toxin-type HINT domain-containing protein [Paenibacillus sp. cl6col]